MKRRLNRRQINSIVRKRNSWRDVSSKYTWDKICDTLDVCYVKARFGRLKPEQRAYVSQGREKYRTHKNGKLGMLAKHYGVAVNTILQAIKRKEKLCQTK